VSAQDKLAKLQAERAEVAAARTREDVKRLAEHWLAAALGQVNGATNYVLNGHVGPAEVQAVLAEYLLETGALIHSITAKVTAKVELTDRSKKQRLGKFDEQIAKATAEAREEDLAAAHAEVEARYGGGVAA
jgi:hypothetical protein